MTTSNFPLASCLPSVKKEYDFHRFSSFLVSSYILHLCRIQCFDSCIIKPIECNGCLNLKRVCEYTSGVFETLKFQGKFSVNLKIHIKLKVKLIISSDSQNGPLIKTIFCRIIWENLNLWLSHWGQRRTKLQCSTLEDHEVILEQPRERE